MLRMNECFVMVSECWIIIGKYAFTIVHTSNIEILIMNRKIKLIKLENNLNHPKKIPAKSLVNLYI